MQWPGCRSQRATLWSPFSPPTMAAPRLELMSLGLVARVFTCESSLAGLRLTDPFGLVRDIVHGLALPPS